MNLMNKRRIKIVFMEPARIFVMSLPENVRKKITYNLLKVEGGEMDSALFKKTGRGRYMGVSDTF